MTPPPAATAAARQATTAAGRATAARTPSTQTASARPGAVTGTPRKPATATPHRPSGAAGVAATRLGSTRAHSPERTARRSVRPPAPSPRAPRRVSGPTRPPSASAPPTKRSANSMTTTSRIGPAGRAGRAAPRRPGSAATQVIAGFGLSGVRRLPGLVTLPRPRLSVEGLLDRIVRGRAWIPVLGIALVGIVVMQVEVLKLGSSVGRSMNTATELSSQIQIERAQVSALASPARIQRLATGYGLSQPGPTDNHFVSARTSVKQAIAGIHPVDASAFTTRLAQEQALDDIVPTAAAQAANATDAGTTPSPADEGAMGSTATAVSQAAAQGDDGTTATDLTDTAVDPTAASVSATVSSGATDSTSATAVDSTPGTTGDLAAQTPTDTPAPAGPATPVDTAAPSTGGSGLAGAAAAVTN
jgi:hypothetical protein